MVAVMATFVVSMALASRDYYREFTRMQELTISLTAQQRRVKALSDENLRIANMDMLTELPNRRQFFADLKSACVSDEAGRFVVGVIDLDGFKSVNDAHGHLVGDSILREVSNRFSRGLARTVTIYRLGGDEFGFLYKESTAEDALHALGQKIIDTIREPFQLRELRLCLDCSIGFAVHVAEPDNGDELYEQADYALYHAKRTGRGTSVIFTHEHARQLREQGMVENTLRSADLEAELYPVFQPIVDTARGRTVAFECLARWKSPVLGEVSPAAFIPVAERSGIIARLTPVMLRKALAVAATWPENIRLSFNLSALDICSADRTLEIAGILENGTIHPSRIDMELTETALTDNIDAAHSNMELLRSMGVSISLDDFGTGYSTLSHMHHLPLDKIKVDRSFVTQIETNPTSQKIVRSIKALCGDVGWTCVVEGVENQEQLDLLQELDCHVIQGYVIARPLAVRDIGNFLAAEERQCKSARDESPVMQAGLRLAGADVPRR